MQLKQWVSEEKAKNGGLLIIWEYHDSMWICGDNTIQNSKKEEYGATLVAGELCQATTKLYI